VGDFIAKRHHEPAPGTRRARAGLSRTTKAAHVRILASTPLAAHSFAVVETKVGGCAMWPAAPSAPWKRHAASCRCVEEFRRLNEWCNATGRRGVVEIVSSTSTRRAPCCWARRAGRDGGLGLRWPGGAEYTALQMKKAWSAMGWRPSAGQAMVTRLLALPREPGKDAPMHSDWPSPTRTLQHPSGHRPPTPLAAKPMRSTSAARTIKCNTPTGPTKRDQHASPIQTEWTPVACPTAPFDAYLPTAAARPGLVCPESSASTNTSARWPPYALMVRRARPHLLAPATARGNRYEASHPAQH